MPKSDLELERVLSMLPERPPADRLAEVLFRSKAEASGLEQGKLHVEVTPDRIDLLSEGGLGLYLQGILGGGKGLGQLSILAPPTETTRFDVDESVSPLRPWISGVIVTAPTEDGADPGLLAEAVRFQEVLHATIGRDRRCASLGLYPAARLRPPFVYRLEPLERVEIVPLDGESPMSAPRFFETHPLALRFSSLGRQGDSCLVLRDAVGTLLSLPPILNDRRGGEVKPGDREILIESTGTRASSVLDSVALLAMVFVARGYRLCRLPIAGGVSESDGAAVVTPRRISVPQSTLTETSGLGGWSAPEVEHLAAVCRLSAFAANSGWNVEVPPWRPDLQTAVDVVEDLVLARGVSPDDARLTPSYSRGRWLPESRFRRRMARLLLGLGFTPLYTPVLVSAPTAERFGDAEVLSVANPSSALYSRLRSTLLMGLTDVLSRNTRHPYPQWLCEVGPVVLRAPGTETNSATRYRAGGVLSGETAGFAQAASVVEYLLRVLDAPGVREPIDRRGSTPGRTARVRIAGENVAELGEFPPSILADLGVPMPVGWFEVDLTNLWPLLGVTRTV